MNASGALLDARPGHSVSSTHGEHVVPQQIQAFVERLVAALEAEEPTGLLDLLEREAMFVGAINAQLDTAGRRFLGAILGYANRWQAEGGPHPAEVLRERVRSSVDDLPLLGQRAGFDRPRYRTSVKAELADWNDKSTRWMRGGFIQVLRQLPLDPPQTAGAPPKRVGRKRSEKVTAREMDILAALPSSTNNPLKGQTELEQRLARSGRAVWDRRTVARSLDALRKDGLVDELRLRRTAAGDRRLQR